MILHGPWLHFCIFSDISIVRKNLNISKDISNSCRENRTYKFVKISLAMKF